jgi:hypothetical protein
MFKEDEPSETFRPPLSALKTKRGGAVVGTAVAQLTFDLEPEPDPEANTPKTLREMFYAAEPWYPVREGSRLSPAVRRLQEKRVNRNLGIVADWLLSGDTLSADAVRQQITWPELEAHEATVALIQEAKKLERE